jgi:hypothetical protein
MPFTFQYRPVNADHLPWEGRATKPYSTKGIARAAGLTWASAMQREGCPVEVRVVELVSDGRCGLVIREEQA